VNAPLTVYSPFAGTSTVEARTIRSLPEMHAFLDACAAKTGAVRLARPIDVSMVAIALADGSTDYELIAREW